MQDLADLPDTLEDNPDIVFEFVERYGTHMITEMGMGSRQGEQAEFTNSFFQELEEKKVNVASAVGGKAKKGAQLHITRAPARLLRWLVFRARHGGSDVDCSAGCMIMCAAVLS
jgi:MAC/Perforin domain